MVVLLGLPFWKPAPILDGFFVENHAGGDLGRLESTLTSFRDDGLKNDLTFCIGLIFPFFKIFLSAIAFFFLFFFQCIISYLVLENSLPICFALKRLLFLDPEEKFNFQS